MAKKRGKITNIKGERGEGWEATKSISLPSGPAKSMETTTQKGLPSRGTRLIKEDDAGKKKRGASP